MATNAKLGNAMLLQVADAPDSDTFITIGALRATSITLNKATVDVTTKDGNGWQDMMVGGGVKSASISGSGVFVDDAASAELANNIFGAESNSNWKFRLIHHDTNVWVGYFNVDSYALSGDANDAETFEVSLSSSDVTQYTTAVLEGGASAPSGGAPDPTPEVDLTPLTVLTLEEINALLIANGEDGGVDSAVFVQINASNEAQYDLTYFDDVSQQNVTFTAFIFYDVDNNIQINYVV